MSRIENHRYSVEEAFRECFYIVPDYQREYVWTEKEVLQLLDDINEQIDGGADREYFIGTVIVAETGTKNHFEVIDGQQRLTTLFLLLLALRNRFRGEPQCQTIGGLISTSYTASDGNTKESLKLEPRYENAGQLMAKIVKMDSDPASTRASIQAEGISCFGSLEKIINAYDTLYRYLQNNFEDVADLKRYWGYLANNVVFIQIATNVSSALKIFETINERGIGLNPMDLLKNLLFSHVETKEFDRLKNDWKKITNPLEKAKERPLRFLRYFLMANYKIDIFRSEKERRDAVVRENEIYDWFIKKENAALCEYPTRPFEFVRKIVLNVELYLGFTNGLGNDRQPSLAMDNLQRLCGEAFSLHFVLLLAASNLPKSLFDHFVAQLESFLFYYIFTKTPTKELERNFSVWADELRAISASTKLSEQIGRLNTFIEERFSKNMTAKEVELFDALKRYNLNSMQQYRTRYLLAKLTQHVDLAYRGLRTPGSLGEYMGLEIEHILPNNPAQDLRDDFAKRNLEASYDEYKVKLGNLTLLEKPINIVAGNSFFELKKAAYLNCKYYLTSSIAGLATVGKDSSITRINEKLSSFDDWTGADIDKRQNMLITLASDIWKVKMMEASE
ncbi:MAG: DUF262 domain-containing protein [Lentisphaeria bacterium]|nr:DUF262 domain-containing protein [Lentisphaeria bacterium]